MATHTTIDRCHICLSDVTDMDGHLVCEDHCPTRFENAVPASDRMVTRQDNGGPALDDGPAPATEPDIVVKPAHYARWAIEPITFIMRNGFEFWRGNVTKYVARAGFKLYPDKNAQESEVIDLEKAIRCLQMRLNQIKGETHL